MSNKTQEEKLRILQERLTQIKEKATTSKKIVKDEISSNKTNNTQKENSTISSCTVLNNSSI